MTGDSDLQARMPEESAPPQSLPALRASLYVTRDGERPLLRALLIRRILSSTFAELLARHSDEFCIGVRPAT